MLASLNSMLFMQINASADASASCILFATFCAQYLVIIPIILLPICWCYYPQSRETIVKAVVAIFLSLMLAMILRSFIDSPRPFAAHLGTNFLVHAADSSLPSKHETFIFTIALMILINHFNYRWYGWLLTVLMLVVASLVGWSRVYLGVHWPFDIIAAMILGLLSAYAVNKNWPLIIKSFNILFLKII